MVIEHEQIQQIGAPPPRTVTPHGSKLLVRFVPAPEQWESGLWMPETMRRNASEAEVLAVGPGRRYAIHPYDDEHQPDASYWRVDSWAMPGDTVLIEEHAGQRMENDEAYVESEDILGIVRSSGELMPLSDWVLLQPESRPNVSRGGIQLADRVQLWRTAGTVLSYGPGALIVKDGCAVDRPTVKNVLNWPEGYRLTGAKVYWQREAGILQVGREQVEAWLCRAGSLVAYDETTLIAEHPA